MDTLGILGQVLECSICLEILDSTSRVLPCQHTFCKACLLDIMSSHKELRCPECRTLVTVPFESLLPNILLMRILEGMKSFPKSSTEKDVVESKLNLSSEKTAQERHTSLSSFDPLASTTSSVTSTVCSLSPSSVSSITSSASVSQSASPSSQSDSATVPPPRNLNPFLYPESLNTLSCPLPSESNQCSVSESSNNVTQLPVPPLIQVQALFNYEQKDQRDLSFKKGDIITIVKKIDDNWFQGKLNDQQGIIPASYVKILQTLPSNVPLCKALYDFKVSYREEKNCLAFNKGEIITLLRRVDDNWVEGKLGSLKGIFPLSFVKLNNTARTLLKLSPSNQPDDDFEGVSSPLVANSLPCFMNTSLGSLSTEHLSGPTTRPQEHLPISRPTSRNSFAGFSSINPSPPSVVRSLTNRYPANVPTTSIENKRNEVSSSPGIKNDSADTTNLIARLQKMSNLKVYICVFGYHPRKADELELIKGRLYIVTEKCQDGWFKGQSLSTDKVGVFPGNYVQHAKAETIAAYISRFASNDGPPLGPICSTISSSNQTSVLTKSNINPDSLLDTPVNSLVPTLSPTHSRSMDGTLVQNVDELRSLMRYSNGPPELPPRQNQTTASLNGSKKSSVLDSPSSSSSLNGNEKKSSSTGAGGMSLIKKITKKNGKSPPLLSLDNPLFDATCSANKSLLNNDVKSPSISPKHSAHPVPLVRERYRCIVAYPPNGPNELRLEIGDLVYVHKKREDGWCKGTHQKTGKTGLFPASFVQSS